MSIEMETVAVEYSSHLAHWKAAFQQLATQQPGQPRVGEQVRVCAHAAIRCTGILDQPESFIALSCFPRELRWCQHAVSADSSAPAPLVFLQVSGNAVSATLSDGSANPYAAVLSGLQGLLEGPLFKAAQQPDALHASTLDPHGQEAAAAEDEEEGYGQQADEELVQQSEQPSVSAARSPPGSRRPRKRQAASSQVCLLHCCNCIETKSAADVMFDANANVQGWPVTPGSCMHARFFAPTASAALGIDYRMVCD